MSVPESNLFIDPSAARDSSPASVMSHKESVRQLAPIALFVYNRPEHIRRTVESLRANILARQSDLFVFSDAAKKESAAAVEAVRKFIRTIDGFKSLTIIERERNCGLANSIIAGVSHVCNRFGRVVAIEDDLLTTADFLTFMNQALDRFADEPKIFSVSGFNFAIGAPQHYPFDAFCSYRSSSLGWGTWKSRWQKADWSVSDYNKFSADRNQQELFNRGGEDLSDMLASQMAGRIDSWAIRWAYTHFKQHGLALLSLRSRVFHIGADGSGTHTRRGSLRQSPLACSSKTEFHFPRTVEIEPPFASDMKKLLRPSIARKIFRYLRRISPATKRFNSDATVELRAEQLEAGKGLGSIVDQV